jgi:hypothetical protein
MECMNRSLFKVRSFSKGRMWELRNRGGVWVRALEFVIILMAFFEGLKFYLRRFGGHN